MTLRVCIDARVPDAMAGGIQQLITGLAAGLAMLDGENEQYQFLAYPSAEAWLNPYLGRNARLLLAPEPADGGALSRLMQLPRVRRLWQNVGMRSGPLALKVPHSDGTIERAGAKVMHFTWQRGFITDVPSIYHPHDLQHVHLPQFFTPRERAGRDVLYRTLAHQARVVATSSEWARRDMICHLGLAPEKVRVVPLAPATGAYPNPTQVDLDGTRETLNLPARFFFYPAQTWPHKNHLALLEALAQASRQLGEPLPLICSGAMNDFFPIIQQRIRKLGLEAQCRFLGFVSPIELQSLYRLATAVVIPTKFEAASFPLWEAFLAGAPAACSNVTSLPEQAGDAALLFDPDDVEGMSAILGRLWTDAPLRWRLASRGKAQVSALGWRQTAEQFRCLYRQLAGLPSSSSDL